MALNTPTTKEISDNIIAQMEAAFGPSLPRSFTRVLAKTLAGVFIILYKYTGFVFLQMFVTTASMAETVVNGRTIVPLIEWGRLIGVGDPRPATPAELIVDITVEEAGGALPIGAQLVHVPTGAIYLTIESVVLNASTVQTTVLSVGDVTGAAANLDIGAVLSFANPLSGVARDAVVTGQAVTGADAESPDAYRQRIIDRFQQRPQGGAYIDYKLWAEEPAGIALAYPYAGAFPGQVDVYIESATEVDGIPTTAQLQEALDAINYDDNGLASRRPVNALANTYPITRVAFSVDIAGLSVSNIAQVQADINAALAAYFVQREPYIVGLSVPPRYDRITQSAVAGVVDDVVSAANGIFTSATLKKAGVATPIYSLGIGEKAKLTGVVYV